MKKILLIITIIIISNLSACKKVENIIDQKTLDSINGEIFPGTVVLGRPDNTSMSASIVTDSNLELYIAYGNKSNSYTEKTDTINMIKDIPKTLVFNGLKANSEYFYTIFFKVESNNNYLKTSEYQFSTPKSSGNDFNFVIQSDSHLLNKADKDIYKQSMMNMNELNPDLFFDLGDTFLIDNGGKDTKTLNQQQVDSVFKEQLPYFDIVTRNTPLFLTIGNHESEYGPLLDGTINNLAAMSTISRTKYYINPIPNNFYTGNTTVDPLFGYLQNYYAFTWGDALFVSIDPYRYGNNGASEDLKNSGWDWSLGKEQYDWFRNTLEESKAKYKFVFSHHAIGNMRGGANIANLYEWGGYDNNGDYLFDSKREGWGKPIQQVMKDTGVTIFFQGHDHLFAREDVDGVIYQTIPKPAEKIADRQNNFNSYNGDVLLNSGFLNVSITSKNVQVDYFRNYLVASGEQTTGVVYSYTVDAAHKVTILKKTEDILSNYGLNGSEKNNQNKIKKSNNKTSLGIGANSATTLYELPAGGFSFAIESDPHFDENTNDELLNYTVSNILSIKPSFLIDLGDTSMIEKLGKTPSDLLLRNNIVNDYFAKFGTLRINMVTGNHDTNVNTSNHNYYSFSEGNALFIVLDPYSFSNETVSKGGGWATTLGKEQYDWLENTLSNSKATFKFVFIHNLISGYGKDSRGGAEAADYFEWGGENSEGIDEFKEMRPDWDIPIHDLLVKYNVDVVFHGHDHFYAKQEKDGIIYQLVPQVGTPGDSVSDAANYSYVNGTFLPSAGFLRVIVSNALVNVEYLQTNTSGGYSILDTYSIKN